MAAVLGLMGVAAVAFAAPPAPRIPRAELESLQASVEAAVTRVSRPAGLMFGRPSRAYHLKGYGAVVVLAPRALPREHRRADGPEARAFAGFLRQLERSIEDVRDPAERRRLEATLGALRSGPPPRPHMPMPMPRPQIAPAFDSESLQEEAEAFRREAERAMEKAEREVLIRLRVTEDVHPVVVITAPEPPEAAAPVEAPRSAVPAVPPVPPMPAEPPTPAVPPVAPAPVVPPVPPAPPAFSFWFGEADMDDEAPPDRVVADVRRAIVAGLRAHRGGLAQLGADEFVVVAVDFVPRMAERSGSRTIVARARTRDLADHRAGRLSAAALDARVEFDEY